MDMYQIHGLIHHGPVLPGEYAEFSRIGVTACGHYVPAGHHFRMDALGQNYRKLLRQFLAAQIPHGFAVQHRHAA